MRKAKYFFWVMGGTIIVIASLIFVKIASVSVAQETTHSDRKISQSAKRKKISLTDEEIQRRIENLRQIIPSKLALLVDIKKRVIIEEAAATQNAEALPLLIKSLRYNESTAFKSVATLGSGYFISAISAIKNEYGDEAGEILYKEALSTNDEGLRERIALTIAEILSSKKTSELNKLFKDEINSTYQGMDLKAKLEKKELKVKLVCYEELTLKQKTLTLRPIDIYCDENGDDNLNILNRPSRDDN